MGAVPPVSLLNGVRERIRLKHCSIRTERAQYNRIRRLVIFRGKTRQSALGGSGLRRCPILCGRKWRLARSLNVRFRTAGKAATGRVRPSAPLPRTPALRSTPAVHASVTDVR